MKLHQGIWLPDQELHFVEWMTKNGELVDGRGTYQIKKFRRAMEYVKQFRTAVDVGGHVGLWSMQLAKCFAVLEAFEPVQDFRDCWLCNMTPWGGREVVLHECALGEAPGRARMAVNPKDTGGTHVAGLTDDGDVEVRTLDSFDFHDVDFIKLDCEGFEDRVLKGALETLVRCKPCVIVEQKPHKLGPNFGIKGTPAVDFLLGLGAAIRAEMSGDYVLSWD